MSQSEQLEQLRDLKRMLVEHEQLRREVQATLDTISRPLKPKRSSRMSCDGNPNPPPLQSH